MKFRLIIKVKVNFKSSIYFIFLIFEVISLIYTTGEMAKILEITASTLRYYDKEGLLQFVERSKSGIRIFKDADYEWLQVINCLKKTGMPLKDIKDFIYMAMDGDETIDKRLQLFLKQKEIIENQIAELQDTLNTINFKCWYVLSSNKNTKSILLSFISMIGNSTLINSFIFAVFTP